MIEELGIAIRWWINKTIKHNRDNEHDYGERFLLHIPIGFYMGVFPFSRGLRELFIRYEESEDKWVKDEAWKDYAGTMAGYVMGRTLLVIIVVYVLLRIWSN